MHYVIYIISLGLLCSINQSKENDDTIPLIALPFTAMYGRWFTFLSLDSQEEAIEEKLNQELDYIWFKDDINTNKLSYIKDDVVYLHSQEVKSKYYQHSLLFNNTNNDTLSLHNFFFHFAQVRSLDISKGGIGLAYKFKDYRNSLVHQMHKEGLINHLIYSFVPNRDILSHRVINGMIYFGGIPNKATVNDNQQLRCKVNDNYQFWNCDLTYFIIGNDNIINSTTKYYKNNQLAIFNAFESNIVAPQAFITFLLDTLFKPFLKDKTCEYHNFNLNQYFRCKNSVLPFLPESYSFVFESKKITLNKDLLFDFYADYCYFNIVNHHRDNDKWIFGKIFLEQFDSVFNYEEQSVTFYSTSPNITFDYIQLPQSYNGNSIMLWMCITIILLGIALFVWRRTSKRKRRWNIKLITNDINQNIKSSAN